MAAEVPSGSEAATSNRLVDVDVDVDIEIDIEATTVTARLDRLYTELDSRLDPQLTAAQAAVVVREVW